MSVGHARRGRAGGVESSLEVASVARRERRRRGAELRRHFGRRLRACVRIARQSNGAVDVGFLGIRDKVAKPHVQQDAGAHPFGMAGAGERDHGYSGIERGQCRVAARVGNGVEDKVDDGVPCPRGGFVAVDEPCAAAGSGWARATQMMSARAKNRW